MTKILIHAKNSSNNSTHSSTEKKSRMTSIPVARPIMVTGSWPHFAWNFQDNKRKANTKGYEGHFELSFHYGIKITKYAVRQPAEDNFDLLPETIYSSRSFEPDRSLEWEIAE
jgi:hypothetical protein